MNPLLLDATDNLLNNCGKKKQGVKLTVAWLPGETKI